MSTDSIVMCTIGPGVMLRILSDRHTLMVIFLDLALTCVHWVQGPVPSSGQMLARFTFSFPY